MWENLLTLKVRIRKEISVSRVSYRYIYSKVMLFKKEVRFVEYIKSNSYSFPSLQVWGADHQSIIIGVIQDRGDSRE